MGVSGRSFTTMDSSKMSAMFWILGDEASATQDIQNSHSDSLGSHVIWISFLFEDIKKYDFQFKLTSHTTCLVGSQASQIGLSYPI